MENHIEVDEIIAYCLSKAEAYKDYPFGDIPICIRYHKKIFAQVYPNSWDYKITLKCNRESADFYRQIFPEAVTRGYHCPPVQQPYWNTVKLDLISKDELWNMIDHAYEQVK